MPLRVANHLPPDREIVLHSENGVLGMGPAPAPGDEDPGLTNASKTPVTLLAGGAYFHHADSFAMMEHLTGSGTSKIVERLTYPVTALACVSRLYTDLAVIAVTATGPAVVEIVDGLAFDELQRLTGVPLGHAEAGARPLSAVHPQRRT